MNASLLVGCEDLIFRGKEALDYDIEDARPEQVHINVDLL